MGRSVLVADLGGTKIAAARIDDTGRITHRLLTPTPPEGGEAVLDALINLVRRLLVKNALVLGVDVPGLADPSGVVWAPNISGWERMPLGAVLGREFNLPVLVESDRNAFVTGEAWQGSARGCTDVVAIAIGTGIGAGIISGGRLIRGARELAGCVGWMAVRDRLLPAYKNVGCLEFHVAGPGIARAGRRIFPPPTDARELVKLARGGNAQASRIIANAGRYLGLALANLVDILNPQVIVIGGGAAGAGSLLIGPAQATMREWAQPLAVKQVRVRLSRLGWRAGLLGVAKLCFDRLAVAR